MSGSGSDDPTVGAPQFSTPSGQSYDPGQQPQVDEQIRGRARFNRAPLDGTAATVPGAGAGQTTVPVGPAVTPALPFPGVAILPFVVEDGSGYDNASSYVTLDYANSYISVNVHVAPIWSSLTPADQMNLLMWASRFIDQRTRWHGDRAYYAQALGWPRHDVQDRDGHEIHRGSIPTAVKQATVEMARYLIDTDRSTERDQDGIREVAVDTVRLFLDPQYRLNTMPPLIAFILMDLGMVSSGRMGSAKIRAV